MKNFNDTIGNRTRGLQRSGSTNRVPHPESTFLKLRTPKCYTNHLCAFLFVTPHIQANLSSVTPPGMTHTAPSCGVADGAGNSTL